MALKSIIKDALDRTNEQSVLYEQFLGTNPESNELAEFMQEHPEISEYQRKLISEFITDNYTKGKNPDSMATYPAFTSILFDTFSTPQIEIDRDMMVRLDLQNSKHSEYMLPSDCSPTSVIELAENIPILECLIEINRDALNGTLIDSLKENREGKLSEEELKRYFEDPKVNITGIESVIKKAISHSTNTKWESCFEEAQDDISGVKEEILAEAEEKRKEEQTAKEEIIAKLEEELKSRQKIKNEIEKAKEGLKENSIEPMKKCMKEDLAIVKEVLPDALNELNLEEMPEEELRKLSKKYLIANNRIGIYAKVFEDENFSDENLKGKMLPYLENTLETLEKSRGIIAQHIVDADEIKGELTCSTCNTKIIESDKWCGVCGINLKTTTSELKEIEVPKERTETCPMCEAKISENASYCNQCGIRFKVQDEKSLEEKVDIQKSSIELDYDYNDLTTKHELNTLLENATSEELKQLSNRLAGEIKIKETEEKGQAVERAQSVLDVEIIIPNDTKYALIFNGIKDMAKLKPYDDGMGVTGWQLVEAIKNNDSELEQSIIFEIMKKEGLFNRDDGKIYLDAIDGVHVHHLKPSRMENFEEKGIDGILEDIEADYDATGEAMQFELSEVLNAMKKNEEKKEQEKKVEFKVKEQEETPTQGIFTKQGKEEMEKVAEYFKKGTDYFIKGKYEKAIEQWELLLSIDSDNKTVVKAIEHAKDKLAEQEDDSEDEVENKKTEEVSAGYSCWNCYSKIPYGVEKCPECGKEQEYECPTCGASVGADDTKCRACGEEFE